MAGKLEKLRQQLQVMFGCTLQCLHYVFVLLRVMLALREINVCSLLSLGVPAVAFSSNCLAHSVCGI